MEDSALKEEVTARVREVVGKVFSGEKAVVRVLHDRLNFACPFCGDSEEDSRKKRANLYWDTMRFCCFNSGCPRPRSNVMWFLRHFGADLSTMDAVEGVATRVAAARRERSDLTYSIFDGLVSQAVPVDDLCAAKGWQTVDKCDFASEYLNKRMVQHMADLFRWDARRGQLCLLNTTRSGGVLGYQTRSFGKGPKYMSYSMEKVLSDVGRPASGDPEQRAKVNTVSLFFGLMKCDFSANVNVFEGVIDSLHLPNSAALTGLLKDTSYLSSSRFRYLLDNDRSGTPVAERLMRQGKSVFLWSKYLADHRLRPNIKDFNELVVECAGADPPTVEGYFSNDPLDLLSV